MPNSEAHNEIQPIRPPTTLYTDNYLESLSHTDLKELASSTQNKINGYQQGKNSMDPWLLASLELDLKAINNALNKKN